MRSGAGHVGSNEETRWVRGVAVACAVVAASPSASAGGEPAALLPTGRVVERVPLRPVAPAATASRACSQRLPICVRADAASERWVMRVLAAAERAWDVETGPLALPPPEADPTTAAYDVYLVRGVAGGAVTMPGARDMRTRVDRFSAYTLLDVELASGEACSLDAAIAASVARASLYAAAPATDEGTARAETEYLAKLVAPCAMGFGAPIAAFQATPERAVADASELEASRGAALFYWWVDASFGPDPGGLVRALWSLSPTMTAAGAERWNDEPDGFDVMRASFKDVLSSGSTVEDLYVAFGVARALLGPRDDGTVLPEARPLGAALAPRIEWTIDWPSTPRRLASPVGLAPTGSTYVLVKHAGAAPGARLRIEAAWESHASIRWTAVKLDAAGRERGRTPIPAPPRATEAQGTIVSLDDVDAVLVVGTNVGDPFSPFDPDEQPAEPHGWLLTLAPE